MFYFVRRRRCRARICFCEAPPPFTRLAGADELLFCELEKTCHPPSLLLEEEVSRLLGLRWVVSGFSAQELRTRLDFCALGFLLMRSSLGGF